MKNNNIVKNLESSIHEFTLIGKNMLGYVPDTILKNKKINRILKKLNKKHTKTSTNLILITKTLEDGEKKRKSRRYIKRGHRRFKRFSKYIEKSERFMSGYDGSEVIIQNLERLKNVNSYIDKLLISSLLVDKDTEYIEEAKKLEPL